jgi:hypothetical protein
MAKMFYVTRTGLKRVVYTTKSGAKYIKTKSGKRYLSIKQIRDSHKRKSSFKKKTTSKKKTGFFSLWGG